MSLPPLVVDLDGTLIQSDILHESVIGLLKKNPLNLFKILVWLARGKAYLKKALAQLILITPETLPFNQSLLSWLAIEKSKGRKLILCTATNESVAIDIANHLGIFDEVIASTATLNLSGKNKARCLVSQFGDKGFDYVGNSKKDLQVWKNANAAIVVNASSKLAAKASKVSLVQKEISSPPINFSILNQMFRFHQWFKNILLFIPLIAAHALSQIDNILTLVLCFIAFGLCASSVYIMNDLLDIDNDRLHPRKKNRPFAAGTIPIYIGVILAPLLLGISLWIAHHINLNFYYCLLAYYAITTLYSYGLKKLLLIDCLTLAFLYTLRIISGAFAVNIGLSFWLLAFSVFLFLSLAFVKRFAELNFMQHQIKNAKLEGRGYLTSDASIIQSLGITSGYMSALILALYLNSHEILVLYTTPEIMWLCIPILLFWVSWIWMKAHRNEMHDDPLVFALKDKVSLISALCFVLVLSIGTIGI